MKPPRCLCSPSCREGFFSETAHNGWHPPSGLSSPYRPLGRSSPGGGSSRGVGGAVGVSPRLSGRSSPGGGSSLGGTSSARGGPGGTTPPRGGTASTSSSASGEVGAVSSLLLLPLPSSHNKSKISVAIASTRQRLATQRY